MRATLLREPLGVEIAPPLAALALRGDDRPFALIGAWAGGGALLGSEPVRVSGPGDDLFALLDALPAVDGGRRRRGRRRLVRLPRVRGAPPRRAGPPAAAAARSRCPDGALVVLRPPAADGRATARWWFEALVTDARAEAIARRREELLGAARARPGRCARSRRATGAGRRRRAATPRSSRRAATRIRAGDLFQANLCLRLQGRLEGDAFDLFATAARGAADRPRRVRRRAVGDGREPLAGAVPHPRRARPCAASRSRAPARPTAARSWRRPRRTGRRT